MLLEDDVAAVEALLGKDAADTPELLQLGATAVEQLGGSAVAGMLPRDAAAGVPLGVPAPPMRLLRLPNSVSKSPTNLVVSWRVLSSMPSMIA